MKKILWADDQIDVAKSFSRVLDSIGVEIDFVQDGEAALAAVEKNKYDLILTDLAMPPYQWGGLWLLEQLSKRAKMPPVIIVSGEGTQAETIKALRLGATDYVTKEQLSQELPQQISSALEARSIDRNYVDRIILEGESDTVEFKSTLRLNLFSDRFDTNIELACLKTIAGFLNASGGTLLIGVDDDGKLVGIEKDRFPNTDKFQLHFWNLIRESIGAEFSEFLDTKIFSSDEGTTFCVVCSPSNRPVFLRWKASGSSNPAEHFYVRGGPQTELLGTRQAVLYIGDHFKNVK